jgi:putative Flp pilus-assembly TadE/G-like protein
VAPHHRSQRGQAAILTIFALTTLIGMVALVVDVGVWRTDRGRMVNAADAAALAGAANLNRGASSAESVAVQAAKVNGATTASANAYSTASPSGLDTVKVTVTAPGKPYFAKLFGIGGFDIKATATAQVYEYTSLQQQPVIPIGITPDALPTFGTEIDLKLAGGGGTTGNYGALQLPSEQNGCTPGTGARDWSDLLGGSTDPCTLHVGDAVPTQPGVATGPTDQGMDQRIGSNSDTFDQVVRTDPNGGLSTIIKPDSPRLVEVPIVVDAGSGSSSFPNGKKDVRIVGFAYFFITSWGGGEIKGILIEATANLPNGSTGPISGPTAIYKIKLIS